jgi:hypothetical protein
MIGCSVDHVRWKSARGWESAKNRLGFGKVVQDGDCEGSIGGRPNLPSRATILPPAAGHV